MTANIVIKLFSGKELALTLDEFEELKSTFGPTKIVYKTPEFQPWGQPIHPFWYPIVTCTDTTTTKNPV
jgi:hypothetical protein